MHDESRSVTHLYIRLGSTRNETVNPNGDFNRSRPNVHGRSSWRADRVLSRHSSILSDRLVHPHRNVFRREEFSWTPGRGSTLCRLLSRYYRSNGSTERTRRCPRRAGQELDRTFPTSITDRSPGILVGSSGLSKEIVRRHTSRTLLTCQEVSLASRRRVDTVGEGVSEETMSPSTIRGLVRTGFRRSL